MQTFFTFSERKKTKIRRRRLGGVQFAAFAPAQPAVNR